MADASRSISRRAGILALASAATAAATGRVVKISAKTLSGETLDATTLRGKPVLLQFWTTWCNFCQSDEGAVESIAQKLGPKGLVVLAVNAYETRQKVEEYLHKHPRESKIALLNETNLSSYLTGRSYPIYVLFDRSGSSIGTQMGAGGEQSLRRLVQRAGL